MGTGMRSEIIKEVYSLDKNRSIMFSVWLIKRMLKRFEIFSSETGHPGTSLLYESIYWAWSTIEGLNKYQSLSSNMCYSLAPDSENFDLLLTSAAIDAANACGVLLDFVNGDVESVVDISILSMDSIDLLIQKQIYERSGTVGDIDSHAAMKSEFCMQIDLISHSKNVKLDSDFVMNATKKSIYIDQKDYGALIPKI